MNNFPVFKIRCSAIGKIMGGNIGLTEKQSELLSVLQSKERRTDKQESDLLDLIKKRDNKELPQGAKTYCEQWIIEQLYGRRKDVSTKYTQKGNIVEDNSIDFVADNLNLGVLFKNEQFFENEYIQGTPDVILPETIIDVKNSWDVFTFPIIENDIPNKDYYWQGQGYMSLTGRSKYILAYVLSDTPVNLIEREIRYYCSQHGIDDIDEDIYNEFMSKMTYSDIPDNLKLKTFMFNHNGSDERLIYERVLMCRDYISSIINSRKLIPFQQ